MNIRKKGIGFMFIENSLEKRNFLKDITICQKDLLNFRAQIENTYNKNFEYLLPEEVTSIENILVDILKIETSLQDLKDYYF